MTPDQITISRNTFAQVDGDTAAAAFYGRLFDVAPGVRDLFKTDMTMQGRKLMEMIGTAVAGLDNIESILPAVRELGARHADYGAEPEHYQVVGEALLWTLEQGLGDAFTQEAKQAWSEAYGVLSSTMIEAAEAAKH